MPHAVDSHVSTGSNPCINKAIQMLLMRRFGILNTLIPGHYILQQLIHSLPIYINWQWNMNINEKTQPPVNCEIVAKYSAAFFFKDSWIHECG